MNGRVVSTLYTGTFYTQVLKVVADLHKQEDCVRVVDETLAKFGRVDILVAYNFLRI